jgi:hypothetical protein
MNGKIWLNFLAADIRRRHYLGGLACCCQKHKFAVSPLKIGHLSKK